MWTFTITWRASSVIVRSSSAVHANHYATDAVPYFYFIFFYFFNQNFSLSFNILFENKYLSKTIRVTWYLYKQWEFLLLFKHSLNIKQQKKTTAHSQNILHVDVLYNFKRKKYKTVCAELAFAKVTFDRMVMIFYRTCNVKLNKL
jgi:hypothetical protein